MYFFSTFLVMVKLEMAGYGFESPLASWHLCHEGVYQDTDVKSNQMKEYKNKKWNSASPRIS